MTQPMTRRLARLLALRDQIHQEILLEEDTARRSLERQLADAEAERQRLVSLKGKLGHAVCGTDGGYYRHIRRTKTPACLPCKQAHAAAQRKRSERRREGAA